MSISINLPENRVFRVFQADNIESPREWDNLGTMVCFHSRYNLGDIDHGYKSTDFESWKELKDHLESKGAVVILPLYLYDHSGITMSTTPFGDRWDSGQVGFIYITKDKILSEYGNTDPETIDKVTKYLENEVKTYDQYLTGEIYGFEIVKIESCNYGHNHETIEDSCHGFYGDDIKNNGILDYVNDSDKQVILGQL